MGDDFVMQIGSDAQPREAGCSPVSLPKAQEPARQHRKSIHIMMLRMINLLGLESMESSKRLANG